MATKPITYRSVNRGGTPIDFKWADKQPGFTLEGAWLGTTAGKFGNLGRVEVNGRTLTIPLPTSLDKDLAVVPTGSAIRIIYKGMQQTQAGKDFHAFDLGVDDTVTLEETDDEPPF